MTAEAFAPFGSVVEHRGQGRRAPVAGVFETLEAGREPSVWVSRTGQAAAWPVAIRALERHPHSSQTFIPLDGAPYLVVVCPDNGGGPDAGRIEAFVAGPHQGVVYRRGVWHHGLTAFRDGALFTVVQTLVPDGRDDEFVTLPAEAPVEVDADEPRSAGWHAGRDFVGYGPRPPHPGWPDGARLALNVVLNLEEGSEPSVPDGDPETETGLTEGGTGQAPGRDLAAESMFEYGSRVGYWRLARLLEERGMTATVMACALAVERNPEIADHLRRGAFDICCHGWRWERHAALDETTERDRIVRAVASLTRTIGSRPLGWYCRYGPSLNTRRLLVEEGGFLYDSDAYNDELPYWVESGGRRHLVVPYSLVNNDAKFLRGALATASDYASFLCDAFDMLYREGRTAPKMMSVGLHLRIAGHPGRAAALERFLDHVARHDGVWVCGRTDIARHWHTHHGADATGRGLS